MLASPAQWLKCLCVRVMAVGAYSSPVRVQLLKHTVIFKPSLHLSTSSTQSSEGEDTRSQHQECISLQSPRCAALMSLGPVGVLNALPA